MDDIGQGPFDFRRVDIRAFVKRLVRYYEKQGNGDWRYAAETIEQQHAEIERLRARVAELEVQLEQSRSLGKLGGYPCTPEHTWAEWLADRNKRVAELEAAQEWRPIESAPKDGAAFLAVVRR